MDEERLRTERSDRKNWKSRVTGIEDYAPQGSGYSGAEPDSPPQRRRPERRAQRADEDDIMYKLAIEASMNEAEEDKKRRESRAATSTDDDDLAKAIKLSKEEEDLRRRELEESNANSLFDSTPAPSTQPQYTGYNQGYQQQGAVDWFGNPVDQTQQQHAQTTGFLNNAYSQQGFQTQPTGYQNGFQPQQTGFDPSQFPQQQQQQASFLQPQPTLQPQQTAFNVTNPYTQQPSEFGNQFQQQQVSPPTAGSHNPWASNPQPTMDALKPAPTGSNNPFGSGFGRPQIQQQQSSPPTLSSLAEHKTATQFSTQPSYNPITSFTPPPANLQAAARPQKEMNSHTARLNALLASGEGMDTFGNTGDLRIPAQHTAPGIFVNSAGQNLNRLHSAQTGNNPFFSQQFTGGPQNIPSPAGFNPQQGRMMPAATGPANIGGFGGSPFGQPNNNPFGAQQHQQQPQGGSLIDL